MGFMVLAATNSHPGRRSLYLMSLYLGSLMSCSLMSYSEGERTTIWNHGGHYDAVLQRDLFCLAFNSYPYFTDTTAGSLRTFNHVR